MNEFGHASIFHNACSLLIMFSLFLMIPYYEANGRFLPMDNITELQISEIVCWCMFIAFIGLSLYVISFLISSLCCHAVYFVQRAWYLHKLRKPERIYTGDLL